MQRFRRLVNHFIVHRPAEQRMRMAHHGCVRRPRAAARAPARTTTRLPGVLPAQAGTEFDEAVAPYRDSIKPHVRTSSTNPASPGLQRRHSNFPQCAFVVAIFVQRCYGVSNLERPLPGGVMANSIERRASRRFTMTLPLTVRASGPDGGIERQGQTRDVSFRGLYFLMDADFEPGIIHRIHSHLAPRDHHGRRCSYPLLCGQSCGSSRTTAAGASRPASTATNFCPPPA